MLSDTLSKQIEGHRAYLVRFARSRVNDPDTAEDLVQDALLAALMAVPRFEQRSTLRTWLTGILLHKITDMRRTKGRELNFSSFGDEPWEDLPDALSSDARSGRALASEPQDPLTLLARKRFMEDLRSSMMQLPPNHRSALEMREIFGYEAPDICRTLGVSSTNLWVMIFRAKSTLRKGLAEHYGNVASLV